MKERTRSDIKRFVLSFIESIPQIDKSQLDFVKKAYPFHAAIFSEEAILYSKQERSIVTRMGMTLFPTLARMISLDSHGNVQNNYSISGSVDAGSLAEIDIIVNELRQGGGKRRPNYFEERKLIQANASGRTIQTRVIADLYVDDYEEGPLFLEIKSPLPNIDICAESKKKILVFELMSRARNGRGYLAFAYNPFVTRAGYNHAFTKVVMDLGNEVLMGSEMWDKIGGKGTYVELINVIDEIGEAKRKELESRSGNK